jgi:hypothetical protein
MSCVNRNTTVTEAMTRRWVFSADRVAVTGSGAAARISHPRIRQPGLGKPLDCIDGFVRDLQ